MDGTNGLQDLSNQEFANDLVSGQYRVTIEPTDWECSVNSIDSGIGITKVIVVPQNDDLIITNGPMIDVSQENFTDGSSTICDVGGQGFLYLNVFNNQEGELVFEYEGENAVSQALDNTLYKVRIQNTVERGVLTINNVQTLCRLEEEINLEIGEPLSLIHI